MRRINIIKIAICLNVICMQANMMVASNLKIYDLQCENMVNPLGLDNTEPRFSWKLQSKDKGVGQKSYEIEVSTDSIAMMKGAANYWKSGKVKSDRQVLVKYGGKSLQSKGIYYWRVKVRDTKGNSSGWSRIMRFSIGMLSRGDFKGSYIGLKGRTGQAERSPILRRVVNVKKTGTALLYVNSLGYHELYINGQKVSRNVLMPAVSQLNKRTLIVTYDVSPYIKDGDNEIAIWLGTGWYKPTVIKEAWDGPIVKAQLDVQENGSWRTDLVTDEKWEGVRSGYEDLGTWRALQFGGERVDFREALMDNNRESARGLEWIPVVAVENNINATQQICEPNVIQDTIEAESVKKLEDGSWLVDMGRVFTGWFSMKMPPIAAGEEIVMEYSDYLGADGRFESQGERDVYVSGGREDEVFCNKFNHHAYRYVKLMNMPKAPELEGIMGYQIYGDYKPASSFECSDADLNKIHDMISYTMKCLTFSGYMVDCPHLERTGYGGDGNSSTMALQTMYEVAPTYRNWIQAWSDAMREGGSLPHVAPNFGAGGGGPYWCGFMVKAPWRTYLNYGDTELLQKYYKPMQQWLEYVAKYSKDGLLRRWPDTSYRDWYLGDWLAPIGVDAGNGESVDLVNNCFISDCLSTIEKIAHILGEEGDAKRYGTWRETLNKKINETFYHSDKREYGTGSQLDMAYPMVVGAVPEARYDTTKNRLKEITEKNWQGHIGGGLVGVPIITEWFTTNKEVDMMCSMLKQQDYPGYLYMIKNGATATWEYWSGERSHVHNCYNGISTWFYEALGGILLDESRPGYRHTTIRPQIADAIEWVTASKLTPYGDIKVSWKKGAGHLTMNVEVPIGVTATIEYPEGYILKTDGDELSRKKEDVGSGSYNILLQEKKNEKRLVEKKR